MKLRVGVEPGLWLFLGVLLALPATISAGAGGLVVSHHRIARDEGGFPDANIDDGDHFGSGMAALGDLDSMGGPVDLAVGAEWDDDGAGNAGAVYVLFLDSNGEVESGGVQKISNLSGNLSGIPTNANFGAALDFLGDYDTDPQVELAVGAPNDGGEGSVWILDLDTDGTVYDDGGPVFVKIGDNLGGFPSGLLDSVDHFGFSVAALGDVDGDGVGDLLVGAPQDDDGGSSRGAVWILLLEGDGSGVKSGGAIKIGDTELAAAGITLANGDEFGWGVGGIGDVDGNGVPDIAVGAKDYGDAGTVFLLELDASGAILETTTLDGSAFGALESSEFGTTIRRLGDLSGIGLTTLAIGASGDSPGGTFNSFGCTSLCDRGAIWLVTLTSDLDVVRADRIGHQKNWDVSLALGDFFGHRLAALPDLNGDAIPDLAVAAPFDAATGSDRGAVYVMDMLPCRVTNPVVYHSPGNDARNPCGPVPLAGTSSETLHLYIDSGHVASTNPLEVCEDGLGDGDEICAFEVTVKMTGGYTFQSFSSSVGADMRQSPTQVGEQLLTLAWLPSTTPAPGPMKLGDLVVATDGTPDSTIEIEAGNGVDASLKLQAVPVGPIALPEPAPFGALLAGACLLALLRRRRALGTWLLLVGLGLMGVPEPSFALTSIKSVGPLIAPDLHPGNGQQLGMGVTRLPDVTSDGLIDFAGGTSDSNPGTVAIFAPLQNGGLQDFSRIEGQYNNDRFGSSLDLLADPVTGLPFDLDGNGAPELIAAGAGNSGQGADPNVTIVFLNTDGSEKKRTLIQQGVAGFVGSGLTGLDLWGASAASLGDIDNDGTPEIAIGATRDGASNEGTIWILSLNPDGTVANEWVFGDADVGGGVTGGDFGAAVVSVGDLDGDGTLDLAVGNPGDGDGGGAGAVWILFLDSTGPGNITVDGYQKISATTGGFGGTLGSGARFGASLAFQPIPESPRGILYVGANNGGGNPSTDNARIFPLHLDTDGTVLAEYEIGYADLGLTTGDSPGSDLDVLGDLDGDEVVDLVVGASRAEPNNDGAVFVVFMQDTDHDGLDDELDNCPFVHNPLQDDGDLDGVGDLCDNCPDLANGTQDDADMDGEGDVCEPVEVQLTTTGTPASPSWNLSVQCGAFDVTDLHGSIVLPDGAAATASCPGNAVGCLTLSGASIGAGSGSSGPGLVSPAGVRDDAIYFSAFGNGAPDNRLCTALDPPVLLGTMTTGAIGGTQLAAAALTSEGVGTPGFGLNLAEDAGGAVPLAEVRLVNSAPLPILDLELGPAVTTASGTKWEVRVVRANDEFHRVAFGLIAPAGTTAANMRWLGCDTTPDGNGARDCCESPPCGDFDGLGVGTNVNPNRAFTVGPQSTPPGTQIPHTMYVVLEGSALSNVSCGNSSCDTVNPTAEGQFHVLGEIELTGNPGLEPALTVDGANDIDDLFAAGKVNPLVDVSTATRNLEEVKLIGAFNPADDVDGDGIQDLGDNCPFQPNPAQTNRGAFLTAVDESNSLGDACECAEATGDGAVLDPDDFDEIFDLLAGKITNPVIAAGIEARCSVAGTTDCNIRDLVFLQQAIAAGDPSVPVRCDAALSPVPAP